MTDDDDFMQEDVDMEDSEEDDDEELDEEGEEAMNDDAPAPQPEPQEEDAAIARRRAIQQIMRDNTLGEQEKRMRIQALMSGGRIEVAPPPAPVIPQPEANAACVHYERNCNIVAPCCNRIFGCRICHDELSPPGHPPMNRFLVREVVCKLCNTRQAAGYVLDCSGRYLSWKILAAVQTHKIAYLFQIQKPMYQLPNHVWRIPLQPVQSLDVTGESFAFRMCSRCSYF